MLPASHQYRIVKCSQRTPKDRALPALKHEQLPRLQVPPRSEAAGSYQASSPPVNGVAGRPTKPRYFGEYIYTKNEMVRDRVGFFLTRTAIVIVMPGSWS